MKVGVSHSSSLLTQSAAGLESLDQMTWKILKNCNYFVLYIYAK